MRSFLLGLGAQKSGTTWLHAQLSNSTQFNGGFCKEYHIFDTLYVPLCSHFRSDLIKNIESSLPVACLGNKNPGTMQFLKLASFLESVDEYYDYFEYLFAKDPLLRCVGDITPAYAMLDCQHLQLIRRQLVARDLKPRVLFIMRDPAERVWSHVKMEIERGSSILGVDYSIKDLDKAVLAAYKTADFEHRTRYNITINAIDNAFDTTEKLYLFYDDLFEAKTQSAICDFLGISKVPFNKNEIIFNTGSHEQLSHQTRAAIHKHYWDVYRFIGERFGIDRVERWLK